MNNEDYERQISLYSLTTLKVDLAPYKTAIVFLFYRFRSEIFVEVIIKILSRSLYRPIGTPKLDGIINIIAMTIERGLTII